MFSEVAATLGGLTVLVVTFVFFLVRRLSKIHGSTSSRPDAELSLTYSPNSLTWLDLLAIIVALVKKYVPGTQAHRCKLVPKDGGFPLPLVRLRGPLRLTMDDVKKFNHALKLLPLPESRGGPEILYDLNPLFLIAVTNPVLLVLLSHPSCPIRPSGAVNTRNEFKFHQYAFCRDIDRLQEVSKAGYLWFTAAFGGSSRAGRPKRRGVEFDVTIQVWHHDDPILTQNLSFMQFLPKGHRVRFRENEAKQAEPKKPAPAINQSHAICTYAHLKTSAPRIWAASCKDYNPIHVSMLAAKLFGFRSVILHGNHAVALAMRSLLSNNSSNTGFTTGPRNTIWQAENNLKVEVTFVKPMSLPATLSIQWTETSAGLKLEIYDEAGTICVAGLCTSK